MHPICRVVGHLYNRIACILSKLTAQDAKIKRSFLKKRDLHIHRIDKANHHCQLLPESRDLLERDPI